MSKIAVLIPSYKPRDYIKRCFEALEKQTLSKEYFSVYVALNGPGQEYEKYLIKVLSGFSFRHRLIYLKEANVSGARNNLIDSSVEPYIAFIDDDDFVSENYLEELLGKADSQFISISNIFNFELDMAGLKPSFLSSAFNHLKAEETSKYKTRKFYSIPCAKLIHRDLIADARFDKRLSVGEDSLFMAAISCRVKGVRKTENNVCYYVYERPGSAFRKKVNRRQELGRISLLLYRYICMLYKGYDAVFILTRIAATLRHIKRLF